MDDPNPYIAPKRRWPPAASGWPLSIAAVWSAVAGVAGGLACGWCVSQFGEFGALSLVLCGASAGAVSRKITRRGDKRAGVCQSLATCLAFFIAETCWLHWNTHNGDSSWAAAVRLWPVFLREYKLSALIGAGSTAYGAWCAYGLAAGSDSRAAQIIPPAAPTS